MKTITEALATQIPQGHWCQNGGDRCPYLTVEKPSLSKNGLLQSYFCDLMEEYVLRKECGINERDIGTDVFMKPTKGV